MLENVYDSLEKKGLFFFDISTMKNGRKNFNSYVDIKDWQEAYIIHVSEFIPEDRIQKTTLDFFIKNYGIYQYAQESHLQKIYTVKEIADLIQKTKFKFLGIYDAEVYKNQINSNLSKLDASFHRLFFVLQK